MARERTNDEWVRDLRAGDAGKEDLRRWLLSRLAKVLSSRGVDLAQAEDFTQDALLRIDAHLDSFRGESQFTTWALSVATRVAFDALRRRRWKDVSLEALDASGPVEFEDTTPTAETKLARARVFERLRVVLETELTPRQREALNGELAGIPHVVLAEQLSMSRNALYKLTHDARRKLKAGLLAAGITATDAAALFE